MIDRRLLLSIAGAALLAPRAFAKEDDNALPPPLSKLDALALSRPDGAATTLGAEHAPGRALVVSLWATWCAPCNGEAKHLSAARTRIAADRLDIIGINVDSRRDEQKIAAFLGRNKVNFAQLRGPSETVYTAFGGALPITLPRLYVFNRDGQPRAVFGRYHGGRTLREIDAAIAAAMA